MLLHAKLHFVIGNYRLGSWYLALEKGIESLKDLTAELFPLLGTYTAFSTQDTLLESTKSL